MDNQILAIIIVVVQIYCIAFFTNILASRIFSLQFLLVFGLFLATIGTILFITIGYFALVFILLSLVIALKVKGKSFFIAIITPLTTILLLVIISYCIDVFTVSFLHMDTALSENGIAFNMIYFVALIFLAYSASVILEHLFRTKIYKRINRANSIMLIVALLVIVVTMYVFIYIESLYDFPIAIIRFNGILFATFFIQLLIITLIITRINKNLMEANKKRIQSEQLKRYITSIETISMDMSQFKHDYINILSSLHSYIEQGDTLQLKTYFKNTITPLKTNLTNNQNQLATLQKINNLTFRATLNTLFTKAKQKRIDLHLEITDHFQMTDEQCKTIEIQLAELINQHQNTKLKLNLTPSGIERMSSE